VLVNGTVLAAIGLSDSDDGFAAVLLPIAAGIGLILYGYRQFRYGEEVEDKPGEFQKAASRPGKGFFGGAGPNLDLPGMMKTGMTLLEDIEEMSRNKGSND